jgi:hypothetical protein
MPASRPHQLGCRALQLGWKFVYRQRCVILRDDCTRERAFYGGGRTLPHLVQRLRIRAAHGGKGVARPQRDAGKCRIAEDENRDHFGTDISRRAVAGAIERAESRHGLWPMANLVVAEAQEGSPVVTHFHDESAVVAR